LLAHPRIRSLRLRTSVKSTSEVVDRGKLLRLPLLQYTLAQPWEARQGNRLTIAAYKELGGLTRASQSGAGVIHSTV
jgi:hypothetical protein